MHHHVSEHRTLTKHVTIFHAPGVHITTVKAESWGGLRGDGFGVLHQNATKELHAKPDWLNPGHPNSLVKTGDAASSPKQSTVDHFSIGAKLTSQPDIRESLSGQPFSLCPHAVDDPSE